MSRNSDEFLRRNPELLDEDATSPETIRAVCAAVAPLDRYFRFRVDGFDRVPPGASLVVANHSVGAVVEILLLLRAWQMHFHRPARGLAHQVAWQPPFRWWPVLQRLGGVFAHPEVARRTLERGYPLLVFPGGDLEACRPFSERYRVTLGGRSGFVKLARDANVPIVPLVICGAHATYLTFPGGETFARHTVGRIFGVKSFPMTAGFGLVTAAALSTLALPLLVPLLAGALVAATVPLPSRIEAEVLPPMRIGPDEDDAAMAERVRLAMQASMDRLAARRLTPWG